MYALNYVKLSEVCENKVKGSMDQEGGGELGLFQFLKRDKATLTYAKLERHQFTNRATKLLTQARKDKKRQSLAR
jgi:hypothetical protein